MCLSLSFFLSHPKSPRYVLTCTHAHTYTGASIPTAVSAARASTWTCTLPASYCHSYLLYQPITHWTPGTCSQREQERMRARESARESHGGTYTRIRLCTHTRIRLCTHTRIRLCTYTRIRLCTHTQIRLCTYTQIRLCTYTRIRLFTYTRIRLCIGADRAQCMEGWWEIEKTALRVTR